MEPRIFHIWDFPNSTRVRLKDQEIFLRQLALKEGSLVSLSQNKSLITDLKEGYGFRWYITPIGQANLRILGGF